MTRLERFYHRLFARFGPQHWWPGRTRWEIAAGAVLTQNTNWRNVEKAIARLRAARALTAAATLELAPAALAELIRPAGYFKVKAVRLQALAAWWVRHQRWAARPTTPTNELRARLLAKGYAAHDADASLTLLASTRLQSDAALAARTQTKLATAGASDAKISRSLAKKGLVSRATDTKTQAGTQAGDAARALTLARAALAKPGTTQSRVRRALGALARAEHDEEVAREAVRQAARETGLALPDEHG